jgi:hypothetical protein
MYAPARITGVAGTARREGKTLNVGDLVGADGYRNCSTKVAKTEAAGLRGVGGAHSTEEGGESRWREGTPPGDATPAGKDRRLWRH